MMETRGSVSRQENFVRNPVIDEHNEVIKGLDGFVESKLGLLLPVDKIWQPSELLPDLTKDIYEEDLRERRIQAANISDPLLVVLIGNTVTEEALPNYTNWFGRLSAVRDNTGIETTPWARWSRGWTAEEYRHGVVLSEYLRYSGRVNMLAVERTVHHLLNTGFDPQIGEDPYKALIYTSHQEQATFTSHGNVAKSAREQGDDYLYRI
jgi:acyl-[acyl-carrier-protein] desaturase